MGYYANKIVMREIQKLNRDLMKTMDARMNHTNEAIHNVKALKLYSWTEVFETEILRRREV